MKLMSVLYLFVLNLIGTVGYSKDYIILESRDAGLYSIFFDVLALVQSYEQGIFQGVEVDFKKTGPYYDAAKGENWWEYYFEPIQLGEKDGAVIKRKLGDCLYIDPTVVELRNSREENNSLIKKYIKIKPSIQRKIDSFVEQNFMEGEFIIGVHYRGTNKGEVPRVSYYRYVEEIDRLIAQVGNKKYKIFLATEEGPAHEFFVKRYKEKLVSILAERSSGDGYPAYGNPRNLHRYQCGEDVVIDCALLSKADILIRPTSNVSVCAGFYNPKVPEIIMNRRAVQPPFQMLEEPPR